MKRKIFILFSLIFIFGCATKDRIVMDNRYAIASLDTGMTKQQVLRVMGNKTLRFCASGKNITINNPYKSTIMHRGGREIEVLYYFIETGQKKECRSHNLSDDELFPLIFENNRIIGAGWDFSFN